MPRPRLHDDALRTRLLEVGSQVISTDGPAALTVRDVARRAGTSASAVYALFGSRDALVAAVGEEATARFARHLEAVEQTADAGADLLALGLAYRSSALADPHFYRVMFDVAEGDGGDIGTGQEPAHGPDDVPVTERPTFVLLRDAVARVLLAHGRPDGPGQGGSDRPHGPGRPPDQAADASAVAVEPALALWGLVHGLVSLELNGLLPGAAEHRTARYTAALRAAGPALAGMR